MATLQPQNHTSEVSPPLNSYQKVFIQRDYSDGTNVKFQTKFPQDLEGKIDRPSFDLLVNTLNSVYAEAEKMSSRTYCEGCLSCLTAYIAYVCIDSHYEKCLRRVSKFIQEQNETVWIPHGLLVTDPADRGLRVIEIAILGEQVTNHSWVLVILLRSSSAAFYTCQTWATCTTRSTTHIIKRFKLEGRLSLKQREKNSFWRPCVSSVWVIDLED